MEISRKGIPEFLEYFWDAGGYHSEQILEDNACCVLF